MKERSAPENLRVVTMRGKLLPVIFAAALGLALNAEVYWLGPRRGGPGSGSGAGTVAALLPGAEKVLFTEKVSVNGFPCTMEISAVTVRMDELWPLLSKSKVENLSRSGGTVRFQLPAGEKMKERFLLIAPRDPRKAMTCFRMLVPEKLPAADRWPAELPALPPGAEITAVTRFGSGGVCGEFRNAQEPPYVLLRRADSELRGKKMFCADDEVKLPSGGRGGIYFDAERIVWVSFDESGAGSFFSRRRK
ncbi:MAG: hypothetical protein IJT50_12680 [Lentisphaeria bacterium]|nr:hypothetical protein [Lentisphaeria bacterium]